MSSFTHRGSLRNFRAIAYNRSDSSSSSTSSSTYSGEEVAVPMDIEPASSSRSGRQQQDQQRQQHESSMFSSFMMSFSPSSSATASSASLSRKRITERTAKLQAVGRDAKEVWKTLPQAYKVDKEFVLYALQNSSTVPAKSDFERTWPQSLRFDRDVVLAWCNRDDFVELYYDRHLFVPDPLKGDKEVMMAYCSKIPRSLQECSEDLCNDRQVVESAISLGGLELQYASLNLQEDKHLIVQACQSHGRALEYCPPGPTRNELLHNRDFMYDVVLATSGGGPMWKLIPPAMRKNDPDMLLQALKHGLLLREVPQEYWSVDFLKQAIQSNPLLYMQLSKVWQQQTEIALEAVISNDSTSETHERALELIPSLKIHRQVVLAICRRGDVSFLQDLLTDSEFCDDEEIMKIAVERDSKLFSTATPRLQAVPSIILASITPASAWNTLKTVAWSIQRANPEIPIMAVKKCISRNLRYLPSHIPEELWTNHEEHPTHRELCLAWIERGGRILEPFERLLANDQELALQVAKYNWPEFYKVGESLLGNRNFMLRALEQDGRVLRFGATALRNDFDLLIASVAHHPPRNRQSNNSDADEPTVYSSSHNSSIQTTLNGIITPGELRTRIQRQLNLHNSFMLDFLRGIAISRPQLPPARRSSLAMLDRGVETSHYFKKLIAEYLGVPTGPKLRLLRQAKEHLVNCSSAAASSASSARSSGRRIVMSATLNIGDLRRDMVAANAARRPAAAAAAAAPNAGQPVQLAEAGAPNRWAAHQRHLHRRRERLRRLRYHRELAVARGRGPPRGNNDNAEEGPDRGDDSDDDFLLDSDDEREENHLLLQHQRLFQLGGAEWEPDMEAIL